MLRPTMRMACVLSLCFSLAAGGVARAGDFDFDLSGDTKKSAAEDLEQQKKAAQIAEKVKLRRRMLTAHQVFGFSTLALLAASLVLGTLNYVDKFGEAGDYSGNYNLPHLVLASASSVTFATGAMLGLTAPNPYPKKIKFDSALVHKLSMALASACFVANLILGPISASRAGELDQRDLATGHLVLGYAAFGFMAAGTLSFVIK
jgi:hypothetical protein